MSLPKTLDRIEEKIDRVLAILEQQPTPAPAEPERTAPTSVDPVAVAQLLDYDTYTAKEIIERAPSLSPEQKAALLLYEQMNAARKTVLEALSA